MALTILETCSQRTPIARDQYRVFFKVKTGTGYSNVRAIDVLIKDAQEEPYKLAELLAIKYIMLHTTYLGLNRTGRDIQLIVSTGAIRKAQNVKTSNADLQLHGKFLQTRFGDAEIKVGRKLDWVKDFSGHVHEISPKDCIEPPVKTHLGDIHLTRHAVERYRERLNIETTDSAWKRLCKLLIKGQWSLNRPPKPLKEGKQSRTTETWQLKHDSCDPIRVVIVRNSSVNRLVTVLV